MTDHPILIADIGGTNARFAIASDQAPHFFNHAQTLACADYDNVIQAMDTYLKSHDIQSLCAIYFAVAGPIIKGVVDFPNNHWRIDCTELRKQYQIDDVGLLNDWEAIAYSLPGLSNADLIDIGGSWQKNSSENFTFSALGPGSGLGMGGLCRRDGNLFPIVNEGGHAGFAPETPFQTEILNYLHSKLGDRVSRERVLSGPGLINIHEALCEIHGQTNPGLSAADIAVSGAEGSDPICVETLNLFFEILGQVAGDYVLSMGAYGTHNGVFIGGGIAQRYPEQLAASNFRVGFENKGRHRSLLQATPSWLIMHKNPGLLGASVYARSRA